ncbi:hypothetical protein ACWGNF_13580 [Streptomyces sp. NPDC055808]
MGVLLALLLLILAPAVAPGVQRAVAEPSPTSEVNGPFVVQAGESPKGDELPEVADKIVENALGEELYLAMRAFELLPKDQRPINTQVAVFTFSWIETVKDIPESAMWVRDRYHDFMSRLPEEIRKPSTPAAWQYPLQATMLDGESYAYDRLTEELGTPLVDPYGNEQMLRLATGSRGSDRHSEDAMNEWFERTMTNTLLHIARTDAERGTIKEVVQWMKGKAGAGIAGPRGFCNVCVKKIAKWGYSFDKRLFIVPYDAYKTAQAKLASTTLLNLKSPLETSYKKHAGEQIDKALNKAGLKSPCSHVNSPQAMGLSALPMAAGPCGPSSDALTGALASQQNGGIDFSSLQLRYLSDDGNSSVKYAFSGQPAKDEQSQDPRTGRQALTDSMAALRTWLALSPDKFWVNLNPSEPDRIIDAQLGRTNAGRALLEADWQMKQSEGKLLDPKTAFGAEYWRRIGISDGPVCYSSRMWIVPGDIEVRQDGSSLYVLKATLDVKAKPENVAGLGQASCNADPQKTARNAQVEQEMVVPKIAQAVNIAPEYAPLRQAFLARIVAQWIRDRHDKGETTSFDKLIGSGGLGPAVEDGAWRPQQVYDAYLRSIREGDFTYKQTTRVGDTVVTYTMRTGGVDFSKLKPTELSAADMNRRIPGLPETIDKSAVRATKATDGTLWLADTAKAPQTSVWERIRGFAGSRTGILVGLVAVLGVLLLFVRDGSAFRRRRSP